MRAGLRPLDGLPVTKTGMPYEACGSRSRRRFAILSRQKNILDQLSIMRLWTFATSSIVE